MVITGSVTVLLITILFLGFDGSYSWHSRIPNDDPYAPSEYEKKIERKVSYFFKIKGQTNWLGIISIFNIAVCSAGFVLFKDK